MKKNIFTIMSLALVCVILLAGCGDASRENPSSTTEVAAIQPASVPEEPTVREAPSAPADLVVQFGDGGVSFALHLYDNATAAAIAKHVGTSEWRLPIYHYDDYENWEVMQYYDIPSRYEIPSAPEQITEEKAGTVYYSEPNRVILFYQDAQVPAEYTPVGYFDYSDEFLKAVQDNPVLEGWGNKIVIIGE